MKIVHISTNDIEGGAARGAYRLHSGLQDIGIRSIMLVSKKRSNDPSVKLVYPNTIYQRILYNLRKLYIDKDIRKYKKTRPTGYELFSDDRSPLGYSLIRKLPTCSIIQLNWVAGLVDYHSFFKSVPQNTPIIWRLSDQNPFTGGCHYDMGCSNYLTECGSCPQLGSLDKNDLSSRIWRRKKSIFANIPPNKLFIAAQSHWMADIVKKSPLFKKFHVQVIPNGIDTKIFKPNVPTSIRQALNIPSSGKVILFVSDWITHKRKGYNLLVDSLKPLLNRDNIFFISVGRGNKYELHSNRYIHLGRIHDDLLLSLIYSAADVFVIPSLQDNLPNTVLEAMACGTPVVGFKTGGIPDMVIPGKTGYLVKIEDTKSLARAIDEIITNDNKRNEMSVNCRKIAVQLFDKSIYVHNYLKYYNEILAQQHLTHKI